MKQLILFDLDGTLIDTLEDLSAAVNHALAIRGLAPHPVGEYRRMVGHGVRNLVAQALEASLLAAREPAPDDVRIDAALADFKAYYSAHIDVKTRPYPGIPELLTALQDRGVRLAVTSNKFQEGTEYLIRRFFPDIRFVAILGNRPGWPLKPSPEIVQEVLRRSGVNPSEALLVGDSPTDMRTAANGGIEALAVTWGYRTREELAGNRIVESVSELRSALLERSDRGTLPSEKHPFEPFLPSDARILFLGSFPPQPHRWCMPFYYPNWINDFWRIMGLIHFGDKNHFCLLGVKRFDEPAIRSFCTEAGLAFYDTASEVRRLRDNASDAFLEVVTPSDIPSLLARVPLCENLVTTGQKATEIIAERFGCAVPPVGEYIDIATPRPLRFWRMPSTSRAYPLPLEKKAEAYRRLFL